MLDRSARHVDAAVLERNHRPYIERGSRAQAHARRRYIDHSGVDAAAVLSHHSKPAARVEARFDTMFCHASLIGTPGAIYNPATRISAIREIIRSPGLSLDQSICGISSQVMAMAILPRFEYTIPTSLRR